MKGCIDFYNDSAEVWANNWYNDETLLPYLRSFLKYVNKSNPRILDLCCGAGYESMRLKRLGAEVVGADLSVKSLEIARKKNPDIEFFEKDMLKSYSDLGMFDGIACIAGIVHVDEGQLDKVFKNMYEVLNNNGYLLLVFRDGVGTKEIAEYNNVKYRRNFIFHKKDEVDKYIINYFDFIEELKSDSDWKYLIYKKK